MTRKKAYLSPEMEAIDELVQIDILTVSGPIGEYDEGLEVDGYDLDGKWWQDTRFSLRD